MVSAVHGASDVAGNEANEKGVAPSGEWLVLRERTWRASRTAEREANDFYGAEKKE